MKTKKIKIIPGGLENVPGYKFSALKVGIRYQNRLDYGLIVADKICQGFGVFTTNKIKAAPVKISQERIKNRLKAILINATNANACTGEQGEKNVKILTDDLAQRLKVSSDNILMASTGIIGHQLPLKKMLNCHSKLLASCSVKKGGWLAKAIMTTDTKPKEVAVSLDTSLGKFRIAGIAKGVGMIAPNMATLLTFIVTDAPLSKKDLKDIFQKKIKKTLNSITIDGDMSTNDSAIILSPIKQKRLTQPSDLRLFAEALEIVLADLAKKLVMDGEGSTKLVKVIVKKAFNQKEATLVAKTVSESFLVKTAFFGEDPNWGRIAMAVGASKAKVKEENLSIYFGEIVLLKKGKPVNYNEIKLKKILGQREFSVTIDLGLGEGVASILTSDLSYQYVKINSAYST
jgi:glutamate N-acetyltransferase/amino-acid N-acetyltransferase